MRILLIEDDKLIGDGVRAGLIKMGFMIDWFTDGLQGKQAVTAAPYDAVILDLSLPGIDGLDILRFWRQNKVGTPVLILTARDAIEQRVTGLQSGADDYLCKPFALAELSARLHSLIRRSYGQSGGELTHNDVCFCPSTRQVKKAGQVIALTTKETEVLELFLHNRERVLSKNLIHEKLYSWQGDVSSNTVEVHIHNLRRKLGNDFIRTVYGTGYALGSAL